MNTQLFPPLCPFGDDEDAASFWINDSRYLVLPMSMGEEPIFMRVRFSREDGSMSYLLSDRASIAGDLSQFYEGIEDLLEFTDGSRELFMSWGFDDLVEARRSLI